MSITLKKLNKSSTKKASKSSRDLKIPKPNLPYSQSQLISVLAEYSQEPKTTVKQILDIFNAIIKVHLTKEGPGVFKFSGMFKMVIKTKAARKAYHGISNLTGQEITIKAKPASKVVRITPMKKLKEMI